jgi:KUP system potassium uptake protein
MLGILGLIQVAKYPEVFKALNPYYAYNLLSVHPDGFFVGFVFLCTTGAEALYSDMGHCGRKIFDQLDFCENYIGPKLFYKPPI